MILTTIAKEKLRNEDVLFDICRDIKVTLSTLRRWISANHKNLTLLKTIESLENRLGMKYEEIFTNEPVTEKEPA